MNLTTTKLENCALIEEYVNQITSTAQKLEGIDMQIPDELIGAILLAGLPGEYRPIIMALESSGTNITADLVKTKLLQGLRDTDYYNQNAQGFFTYGPRMPKRPFSKFKRRGQTHARSQSRVRCYKCNQYGHYTQSCDKPDSNASFSNTKAWSANQPDLQNSGAEEENIICAFSVSTAHSKNKSWFLDSCASAHMCNDKSVMTNLKTPKIKSVVVANKGAMQVEAQGEVILRVYGVEGSETKIRLKDVLYIPGIASNLISVGEIDKNGCSIKYQKGNCEITNSNNKIVATAAITQNSIYKLTAQPVHQFDSQAEKTSRPTFKNTHTNQLNADL